MTIQLVGLYILVGFENAVNIDTRNSRYHPGITNTDDVDTPNKIFLFFLNLLYRVVY